MSSFEILNQALITYSTVVRDNFTTKADAIDVLTIITNTSNELKDLINKKADNDIFSSIISGNSNEFMKLLDDRVLISSYEADNIQSNIRFNTIETLKANAFNTELTGLTKTQTIQSSGDIRTNGTLYASNLHILGDTSIVNTITTVTDQLTVSNDGNDTAVIIKQYGTTNIAEFYNADELKTIIDKFGRVGINTIPRYELDVSGSIYGTIIYGDSSKTTINNVFIEDIFSCNLQLINNLNDYVSNTFYIIESNINIITNTINYGKEQLLNTIGITAEHSTIADRLNYLEQRITQLEQRL
jgi:hypothetical protein